MQQCKYRRNIGIFAYLCDAAVLEEARFRLGMVGVTDLLGVRENQFYVYRSRILNGKHRLPEDARQKLIDALMKSLRPEEVEQLRLESIERKLDRLLAEPRPADESATQEDAREKSTRRPVGAGGDRAPLSGTQGAARPARRR